ncbi:hypothetical protein KJ359_007209 [Pestalotiopsis sp. 9143b]|nr:hypothetical protein KJ359_007209 [Pestalotiopsis sp. 9143b]
MSSEASRCSSTSVRPIPYKRLSSRIPEIRLLEIDTTGDINKAISCRMVNVPLSSRPVFVGLSVLTGDSTIAEIILIDQVRVSIPATLAEAIRHVRAVFNNGSDASSARNSVCSSIDSTDKLAQQHDASSVKSNLNGPFRWLSSLVSSVKSSQSKPRPLRLWTDSICINEEDSKEAAQRSRLMQEAYRRARTVVGWLGYKDARSRLVIETIRSIDHAMPRNFGSPKDLKEHPEHYAPPYSWMEEMAHLWQLSDEVKSLDDWPVYEAMGDFMMRPYFQNSWIVRELASAKYPTFLLQGRVITWMQVLRMNRALEELVNNGAEYLPADSRERLNLFALDTIFIFLDAFEARSKVS